MVRRGYAGKFETEDLTPLVSVGDRYVLELFRGPTSAFKDVALSLLPQLISQARDMEGIGDEMLILTATSGDTGKAALEAFGMCPAPRSRLLPPRGRIRRAAGADGHPGGRQCEGLRRPWQFR